MDISKMTVDQLVDQTIGRASVGVVPANAVFELARRLKASEARAGTYWAECEAWRKWHDDESDRGDGWIMELVTNVDKARAATDAAKEVRSE